MDGYGYGYSYGSVHHPQSGERRLEIVSGKRSCYGSSHNYRSDLVAVPGELTRASHNGAASAAKPWSFGDPEAKRRKRIARYKVYAVEGRVKDSLRNGIRWIKNQCSRIIHGY